MVRFFPLLLDKSKSSVYISYPSKNQSLPFSLILIEKFVFDFQKKIN